MLYWPPLHHCVAAGFSASRFVVVFYSEGFILHGAVSGNLIPKLKVRGRDSVVDVGTLHVLEGPGISFQLSQDPPHLLRPSQGPNLTALQWVPGLFPGGKAAGAWRRNTHF